MPGSSAVTGTGAGMSERALLMKSACISAETRITSAPVRASSAHAARGLRPARAWSAAAPSQTAPDLCTPLWSSLLISVMAAEMPCHRSMEACDALGPGPELICL